MLAPLEDRSIIERDPAEMPALAALQAENLALSQALRQARRSQRRNATQAVRQTIALNNEIARLQQINHNLRQRCAEYASGQAIVSLGQRLLALAESNAQLRAAAQQVWYLDKSLGAARHECKRLARERAAAISRLRLEQPWRPVHLEAAADVHA